MKVLVTGAAGFIGYHLCKNLLLQGHSVIGLDNFSALYDTSINKWRFQDLQQFSKFEFIFFDVSKDDVSVLLKRKGIDYLVHAAAKDLFFNEKKPTDYTTFLMSNVLATARMFELGKSLKIKKFILLSTYIVYGNTKKEIFTEKKILPKPVNNYAASRLAEEQAVEFMSTFYNIPCVVLRIFSAYGPASRPGTIVPYLVGSFYNNKKVTINKNHTSTRDFVYIDDVIRCIRKSMTKRLKFQVINVASGVTTDDIDLTKTLASIMEKEKNVNIVQKRVSNEDIKVKRISADNSKARKMLNLKAPTMLDEGLRKTVAWYKKNPEFLKASENLQS